MPTPLQNLIRKIEPLPHEIDQLVDSGLNTFAMPKSNVIDDRKEFQILLGKFFRHIENTVLRISTIDEIEIDFYTGRSLTLLEKEFGRSVFQMCFDIARTGNEGGMYAVLKKLAKMMGDEYLKNQTGGFVSQYLQTRFPDEIIADSKEYVETYGHLLPSEISECNGIRVQANFFKVLQQHPGLVRRLKQTTR